MNKKDGFEYLVQKFAEKNNDEISSFTTLKILKLLFFVSAVSATKENHGLLTTFDKFVAMPYGPVESDIYNAIRSNSLSQYKINRDTATKLSDYQIPLSDEDKKLIDDSVEKLLSKNDKILDYTSFQLVDLSHKWSCWEINFSAALNNGSASSEMTAAEIISSIKYYKLPD